MRHPKVEQRMEVCIGTRNRIDDQRRPFAVESIWPVTVASVTVNMGGI